jgi:hypothetical protein
VRRRRPNRKQSISKWMTWLDFMKKILSHSFTIITRTYLSVPKFLQNMILMNYWLAKERRENSTILKGQQLQHRKKRIVKWWRGQMNLSLWWILCSNSWTNLLRIITVPTQSGKRLRRSYIAFRPVNPLNQYLKTCQGVWHLIGAFHLCLSERYLIRAPIRFP